MARKQKRMGHLRKRIIRKSPANIDQKSGPMNDKKKKLEEKLLKELEEEEILPEDEWDGEGGFFEDDLDEPRLDISKK